MGYFGPYETKLRGTLPRGHMVSCGAGRWGIGIEAHGTIKGCPSLSTGTWAGGNIRDAPLQDIVVGVVLVAAVALDSFYRRKVT